MSVPHFLSQNHCYAISPCRPRHSAGHHYDLLGSYPKCSDLQRVGCPNHGTCLHCHEWSRMGSGEGRHGGPPRMKSRLPITPTILAQLRPFCTSLPQQNDLMMLWAATMTCFFGFFRAGEITLPTSRAFDPTRNNVDGAWLSTSGRQETTCALSSSDRLCC